MRWIVLLLAGGALLAGSRSWAQLAPGPPGSALSRVQAALDRGEIGESEAARQKLHYLFDRARMDPRWGPEGEPPAKCGTVVVDVVRRNLERLDESTRAHFARYVSDGAASAAAAATYETPHFRIEYETSGPDAPPSTDVAPANGIPDFVERTGEAAERSWAIEVDSLGYRAPQLSNPGPRYTIRYQDQSSYGFTVVVSGQRTQIVLHPSYENFPFNDDPDGDAIGSLRVTVAHELKHAIQRMYSNWVEDGWLELDATWIEDVVFDDVDDYLHFIRLPGSPFTAPQVPLNSGGTGSYEDCNWQHYQTQKYGNDFLRRFWDRRAVNIEPVISTYTASFAEEGNSFEDAWGEYVSWNVASGARAGVGYGYEEAALHPTPPVATLHTTLPVPTTTWTVDNLAAGVHLIDNPDGALAGTPEFTFTGSSHIAWRVSVVLQQRSGTVTRVPVPLIGGAATLALSEFDWADLRWASLVVGNPYEGGPPFAYTFSARSVAPIHIAHARVWNATSNAGFPIVARVTPGTGSVSSSSVTLDYRIGGGALSTLAMTPTGNPDEFAAQIPGQPFGAVIEYAIGAQSSTGEVARAPAIAGALYSFQVVSAFEPFEASGSWTVGDAGDDATAGVWERAEPRGTVAAPYTDATLPPGVACFVTQNGAPGSGSADTDVDGGKTTLLSPVFTFGTGHLYDEIRVRYRRWYSNDIGSRPDDAWRVDASNDGGATWTNVETLLMGESAWVPVTVDLIALFGTPDQVRFRFVAQDLGNTSIVEAGIDDFEILAILHDPVAVAPEESREMRLGAPTPNPSRGRISLGLFLPRPGEIRAVVRDLQGRLVRRLVPRGQVVRAGSTTLVWDGVDERGQASRAGLYFIEVEAAGHVVRTRATLIR